MTILNSSHTEDRLLCSLLFIVAIKSEKELNDDCLLVFMTWHDNHMHPYTFVVLLFLQKVHNQVCC